MTSDQTGRGTVDCFGHYEDEMIKLDGLCYFARQHQY
jgi:hypothetical protein